MLFHKTSLAIGLAVYIPLSSLAVDVQNVAPVKLKGFNDAALLQSYRIGDPEKQTALVKIYKATSSVEKRSLVKRSELESTGTDDDDDDHEAEASHPPSPPKNQSKAHANLTTIDMTPAECTKSVCYIGSFQAPSKTDCDVIVEAQLYNSTGSLTAFPGTYVIVSAGTCAVVFQNPEFSSPYALQYNWAMLGNRILELQKKCDKPDEKSIGGACLYKHYLKYKFENVLISLQHPTQ